MCPENMESKKGIYALIISIQQTICFPFKSQCYCLEPGIYVYIGSAHGPGGVKGRVERHLRHEKKIKWHIDNITISPDAKIAGIVYASTENPECILTPKLEKLGFTHPIPGFGSSDCKRGCRSHLLACHKQSVECIQDVLIAFKESGLRNVQVWP